MALYASLRRSTMYSEVLKTEMARRPMVKAVGMTV